MSDLHTTIVTLCTAASVAKSAARLRRIGRLLLSSCPALGRGLSTRLPKGGMIIPVSMFQGYQGFSVCCSSHGKVATYPGMHSNLAHR